MAYKIIRNLYMAYQEGSEIVAILDSAAGQTERLRMMWPRTKLPKKSTPIF